MADEHGVTGGDRELLVEALTAALSGDGAAVEAVRTELRRARDRASAGQAYELAGRIEAELEGLDWVTAPQRVSLLEPVDCDIVGWSDEMMVTFGMRAGRLSRWSQQRCARSEAEAGLADSPPEWARFARRNAELAAALAVC
jgi:excinuclease ABC subunit C